MARKEFSPADEVKQIAEKLIEMFRPEMIDWEIPIEYVFSSENPKVHGVECVGVARVITGINAYFAGHPEGFFCIETGVPAYDSLTLNQKIAYVHHELLHFGINDWGSPVTVPHDIEEFTEVARVHGAYFDRLQIFADAVEEGNSDSRGRDEIIDEILKKI